MILVIYVIVVIAVAVIAVIVVIIISELIPTSQNRSESIRHLSQSSFLISRQTVGPHEGGKPSQNF